MYNCFILKEIESKKDGKHYFKLGFGVYKNGVKVHFNFISETLFHCLKNCCPIIKASHTALCDVYFVKVVD